MIFEDLSIEEGSPRLSLDDCGFSDWVVSVLEWIEREGRDEGGGIDVEGGCVGRGGAGFWNVPRSTGLFLFFLVRALRANRILEIGTSSGYSGIFFAEGLRRVEDKAGRNVGDYSACARSRLFFSIESNEARFELGCANFVGAEVENAILIRAHAPEVFNDDKYFEDAKDRVRFFGTRAEAMFGEQPDKASGSFGATLELGARSSHIEALRDLRRGEFDLAFFDATKGEYLSYLKAVLPLMSEGGMIVADNCGTHSGAVKEFIEFVQNSSDLRSMLLEVDNGLLLIKVEISYK